MKFECSCIASRYESEGYKVIFITVAALLSTSFLLVTSVQVNVFE